mmetsp:Transcript_15944/g.18498  ORF Transcript_15944/g.18498 Transcript_15944/m.18498 type:complete len:155 (-) Transcript_15944:621-1085(-)
MLIYSFNETRETRLKVYTEDIMAWNNTKREQFANNIFRLSLITNNAPSITSPELGMKEDESVEHQLDAKQYGDLPSYTPLYYSLTDKAESFGIGKISTFKSADALKFNLMVGESTNQQIVSVPALPLYYVKSFKSTALEGCTRLSGHYESSGKT